MYTLAIHGGAGTLLPEQFTSELKELYGAALLGALHAGESILKKGGAALDAVEAAVANLEDNALFNAGKGSVFNHVGQHQMDAAIMDGWEGRAGAVALVTGPRNPIKLARVVMEKSDHVLLAGPEAEAFARLMGIDFENEDYFYTKQRYDQWKAALQEGGTFLDHTQFESEDKEKKFGTVGSVALDVHGRLAAATSTGGMTTKKWGRIGDTPIIGAGTYANKVVAISCTGWGEHFMRHVVAHRVANLMELAGMSLEAACNKVVMGELENDTGGLIAIDHLGNYSMPFNTPGMYRGVAKEGAPSLWQILR